MRCQNTSLEKGKTECPEELKEKVLRSLMQQFKDLNISTIDGVKIWFEDKSAILIRPSGTEPIYRLYAEAKTPQRASNLISEYSSKLKRIIDSSTLDDLSQPSSWRPRMSSTLHMKPEDVDTREKRAKYTVTIMSCEQDSLLYSCLFADAGFSVICTDLIRP